jgi:hypothetical protein
MFGSCLVRIALQAATVFDGQTSTEPLIIASGGNKREAPMAGTVKHARLESQSARNRLKRGRQPHWQALVDGKVHLGWQCWKGDAAGRWVLRRYIGNRKYRTIALGLADDAAAADGVRVLSYEQAEAKARAMVEMPNGKIERLTVRQALDRYIEHKRDQGQPVRDVLSRSW